MTSGSPLRSPDRFRDQRWARSLRAFIKDLLIEADRRDFRFIINFVPRDYDPLCIEIGCGDADRLWEDTGLYDENGVARPALTDWREQLSRRLAR